MKVKLIMYGGQVKEIDEAHIDPMGITYHKENSIVLPGEEDSMTMVMIPWAAVTEMEYVITPEMIASQDQPIEEPVAMNRKQRRAVR